MTTADLSLRHDPIMEPIARRFHQDQQAFADTFASAWFKLTHRDLGPRALYLGPEVPAEELIWQDPLPPVDHPLVDGSDLEALQQQILATGLTVPELVATAWASASSFRGSDKRGGANGARLRLQPQRSWEVNDPDQLSRVLAQLEAVQASFNGNRSDGKRISLADLIVLAGGTAVEQAAAAAGHNVRVPFRPGRTDASAEQTDSAGFNAPELTVLVGGLRVLGANSGGCRHGVFTERVGVLSTDFFANLLDMGTVWGPGTGANAYEGRNRSDGSLRWTATRADLVFGSNSQLRAIAEIYAQADGAERFIHDFVTAWVKVMELDRFDLQ